MPLDPTPNLGLNRFGPGEGGAAGLINENADLIDEFAGSASVINVSEPPPVLYVSPSTGDDSFEGRWDRKLQTLAAALAALPSGGRVELTGETFTHSARLAPGDNTHVKGVPGKTKIALPSGSVHGLFDVSNKHLVLEDLVLDGTLSGGAAEPNPGAGDTLYPLVMGVASGGGTTLVEFRGRCHLIQGTVPDAPGSGAQKGRKGVHIECAQAATTTYIHGSIGAGGRALTVTDGAFTQADVGKRISIAAAGYNSIDTGAGGLGAPETWWSWILSVSSATVVVIYDLVPTTTADVQVQVFGNDGLATVLWDQLEIEGGYRAFRTLGDVASGGRRLIVHDTWDYGALFERGDRRSLGKFEAYRCGLGDFVVGPPAGVPGGGISLNREHRFSAEEIRAWDCHGWGAVISLLCRDITIDKIEEEHCGIAAGATGYGGVTLDTAQAAVGVGHTVEGTLWPVKAQIGSIRANGNPNGPGVNFADVQDAQCPVIHASDNGGNGVSVNSAEVQIGSLHADDNTLYPIRYSSTSNPDTWSPPRGKNQLLAMLAKGNGSGDVIKVDDSQLDTAMFLLPQAIIVGATFAVPIVGGEIVWTNMPAALTEGLGQTRYRQSRDLSGFTRARMSVRLGTVVGAVGAKLFVQASPDNGSTWYHLDGSNGASPAVAPTAGSVDIRNGGTASADLDSGWFNLSYHVKGDMLLRFAGIGGDGVIDPTFGTIALELQA